MVRPETFLGLAQAETVRVGMGSLGSGSDSAENSGPSGMPLLLHPSGKGWKRWDVGKGSPTDSLSPPLFLRTVQAQGHLSCSQL